ncbi:MAG: quinone oxidoreductase family protein [Solirubrobacterales bacterium]
MRAVQITEFGGPEVLKVADVDEPLPADGEVVVDVNRAGVNFADTHKRRNEYLAKSQLPLIPGVEVAGRKPDGRRVAAVTMRGGGYAERCAVRESEMFDVPDGVTDAQAAAVLVQGLTAQTLLAVSARMTEGESVVVHAAAGGTGSLCVQLARRLGAGRIIATASTEEKRELALELGADVALDSRSGALEPALLEANDGACVDVVLDSVGGDTFDQSLAVLAPFGRLVTYGIATRQPNEVRSSRLMRHSRGVVGFWLVHLLERPELACDMAAELFAAVADGALRIVIGGEYALADAADAHRELGSRGSAGKLLIDPTR